MSIKNDIIQGVRLFLKSALSLDDDSVILAHDKGPRPALPYCVVRLISIAPQGEDEEIYLLNEDEEPVLKVRGHRLAQVEVQTFGAGAEDWLDSAVLALRFPSIKAILDTAGFSISSYGGITDLTGLLDTSFESRAAMELTIAYRFENVPEVLVELMELDVEPIDDADEDMNPDFIIDIEQ